MEEQVNVNEEVQDQVEDVVDTPQVNNSQEETKKEETKNEKLFTQEELDFIIQKRLDREIKKFQRQLEEEKSEAEKLAKMSEEEKAKALLEKQKAEFEAERKQFLQEKLELETVKQLSELNLPTKFSNFLVRETAEDTKANLDVFAQLWNEEMKARIEKEVEERLKGTTPKKSSSTANIQMTKKEFGLLPYSERERLMKEEPELVKQILSQN